jgi:hypothetical protein
MQQYIRRDFLLENGINSDSTHTGPQIIAQDIHMHLTSMLSTPQSSSFAWKILRSRYYYSY